MKWETKATLQFAFGVFLLVLAMCLGAGVGE